MIKFLEVREEIAWRACFRMNRVLSKIAYKNERWESLQCIFQGIENRLSASFPHKDTSNPRDKAIDYTCEAVLSMCYGHMEEALSNLDMAKNQLILNAHAMEAEDDTRQAAQKTD